jgi:hypothetical protein
VNINEAMHTFIEGFFFYIILFLKLFLLILFFNIKLIKNLILKIMWRNTIAIHSILKKKITKLNS